MIVVEALREKAREWRLEAERAMYAGERRYAELFAEQLEEAADAAEVELRATARARDLAVDAPRERLEFRVAGVHENDAATITFYDPEGYVGAALLDGPVLEALVHPLDVEGGDYVVIDVRAIRRSQPERTPK